MAIAIETNMRTTMGTTNDNRRNVSNDSKRSPILFFAFRAERAPARSSASRRKAGVAGIALPC